MFERDAVLELTHNWGTEQPMDETFYHDGNSEPKGCGHGAVTHRGIGEVSAAAIRTVLDDVLLHGRPLRLN